MLYFLCGKAASLRQSRFSINLSLSSELVERRFFYFGTVFITSFERGRYRGIEYYKQKHPSRGVPYIGDLKEKAKSLENYLRGVYF